MKNALAILIVAICSGCSAQFSSEPISAVAASPSPPIAVYDETVKSDIPKTTWQPIFHEAIDKWTSDVGVTKLRNQALQPDDLEVRVWGGFGITTPTGFLLNRTDSKWSASYVAWGNKRLKKVDLAEPTIGWAPAWQSLLEHKIVTLPDARSINCNAGYLDGYSYVVEIKKGADYRTYMYDNPWGDFKNRCHEADEILSIATVIMDTYQVPNFRVDD